MKNFKRFFLLFAMVLITASISQSAFASSDIYTVKEGDTLWVISKKYKVKLNEIIEANKQFKNPDLIHPGDKVNVPLNGNKDKPTKPKEPITPEKPKEPTKPENPNEPTMPEKPENPNVPGFPGSQNLSFENEVITLVNKERLNAGLTPFAMNPELSNVARHKSNDMRDNNYFSHNSPTYGSPFDMLKKFNVRFSSAGENIAKGQSTPQAVVTSWMNSPGHRKNIMSTTFTEIGVGFSAGENSTHWTQMFITP
jgi:uncharacterized YkwD family protein/spore coat assembly protein SafA